MNTVLVTGVAGFIGMHCAQRLLAQGLQVVGIDNRNSYYDVALKDARLAQLQDHPQFRFVQLDLANRAGMAPILRKTWTGCNPPSAPPAGARARARRQCP